MAELDPAPWRRPACADAVAGSLGGFTWAVRAGRWDDLPAEVAALVAPPLVVSASSRAGTVAPAQAGDPQPSAGPRSAQRQPEPRPERRLELVLFPPDRSMLAPGQSRAGRHRRPARAS